MKDIKEVVLFFDNDPKFDAMDVAKDILGRYEELGNPIIIPATNNKNNPVIVFKENSEFQIQVNLISVSIVIKQHFFEHLETIIFDIVDAFESFECSFKRIGYISSIFLSPKYVEKAKKRFLNATHLETLEDFNLNFYHIVKNKLGNFNCWERIITDKDNFKDLLCQYDINSIDGENFELNMKNIKEFITSANKYIEDRLDY